MAAAPRSAGDPTTPIRPSTDAPGVGAPLRVLVTAGTYAFDNVGDIAMARVAIDRVRAAHPDARISLLATSQAQLDAHGFADTDRVDDEPWRLWSGLVRRWHLRLPPGRPGWQLPFRHPDAVLRLSRIARSVGEPVAVAGWVDTVRSADLVVICGQGAIHDGSDRRTERLAHLVLLADALGVPVVAVGQGIGPLTGGPARRLVGRALPRLAGLGLREAGGSVDTVRSLGLAEDRWTVTGDDAIQVAIDAPPPLAPGDRIGVSMRENRAAGPVDRLPEVVAVAIESARPGVGLELVAMMESPPRVSDRALLDRVRPAGDPDRQVRPATVGDALAGLARCRVVVTGTYHAAVFAQALGVPVVALAATDYYRQKMHGAIASFGGGGGVVLDPTDPDFAVDLARAIDTWWDRAPEVRGDLLERAAHQAADGRAAAADWLAAGSSDRRAPRSRPVPGGPKTVLYVQHYPDGGSITGLLDLVRGLDPARYRPVVSFRDDNPFRAEFEAAGIATVVVGAGSPARVAPDAPPSGAAPAATGRRSSARRRELRRLVRRDLPAAWRLRAVIRAHGVTLVHANNDVLSNRDAIIAAALTRRPVVVHVRWLHDYANDAKLGVDRLLARRAARVLFMSRAIAESCAPLRVPASRRLVLDDPFHVEDYEVDAPPGLAAELGLPVGGRVVLHVGRIVPWKGQDVFLRAMARVLDAEPDAVALLVGTTTGAHGERFLAELHALADELGIADRVVFAGSRRDVPELIALAEVVVHCSTTPEPFGRVVVEAMAGARPVVGADAGGVPEIIDPGVTGLLVATGDDAALGSAVAGLLADPAAASAMGARARATVAARFTLAGHARAVQGVYDDVLGR